MDRVSRYKRTVEVGNNIIYFYLDVRPTWCTFQGICRLQSKNCFETSIYCFKGSFQIVNFLVNFQNGTGIMQRPYNNHRRLFCFFRRFVRSLFFSNIIFRSSSLYNTNIKMILIMYNRQIERNIYRKKI